MILRSLHNSHFMTNQIIHSVDSKRHKGIYIYLRIYAISLFTNVSRMLSSRV